MDMISRSEFDVLVQEVKTLTQQNATRTQQVETLTQRIEVLEKRLQPKPRAYRQKSRLLLTQQQHEHAKTQIFSVLFDHADQWLTARFISHQTLLLRRVGSPAIRHIIEEDWKGIIETEGTGAQTLYHLKS